VENGRFLDYDWPSLLKGSKHLIAGPSPLLFGVDFQGLSRVNHCWASSLLPGLSILLWGRV
jgi:hypothetical protein